MAKTKPKTTEAAPVKENLIVIRGYRAWRDWMNDFASDQGMSTVALIDFAMRELAAKRGFRKPPRRF